MQQKQRRIAIICNSLEGSGEHNAKYNQPGSESQIPYDLTYEWK